MTSVDDVPPTGAMQRFRTYFAFLRIRPFDVPCATDACAIAISGLSRCSP
jgi:hypothetical protein